MDTKIKYLLSFGYLCTLEFTSETQRLIKVYFLLLMCSLPHLAELKQQLLNIVLNYTDQLKMTLTQWTVAEM